MDVFLHSGQATLQSSFGRWTPVAMSCPFCGASTDLPHESQEACIAALQREIARTREIVERVKPHPKNSDSGNDPTPEFEDDHER